MAAYRDNTPLNSGFTTTTITSYVGKYIDVYNAVSSNNTYNYRILGDATGEMGPFYSRVDADEGLRFRNSWYTDRSFFVSGRYPWFLRGGGVSDGTNAGQFNFHFIDGNANVSISARLVLAP